ncbi:MAG: 30S ribosomal protein S18 [Fimbriimonadales bacterium]|nr:30S ribosomal protein S18 [Fimbriimonadales bacterium]
MSDEQTNLETSEPESAAEKAARTVRSYVAKDEEEEDRGSRRMGGPKEPRPRGKRRRKVSFLTVNKIDVVTHRDVDILRRFINDQGKILSARQTGNTAKQQRMVSLAIRRAREMALLPFTALESWGGEYSPGGRGRRPRPDSSPRD